MSYILEALKKAQAERQIGSTPTIHAPTLASVPAGQGPRSKRTPVIVAMTLMAAAIAGLATMLVRQQPVASQPPASVPTAAVQAGRAAPSTVPAGAAAAQAAAAPAAVPEAAAVAQAPAAIDPGATAGAQRPVAASPNAPAAAQPPAVAAAAANASPSAGLRPSGQRSAETRGTQQAAAPTATRVAEAPQLAAPKQAAPAPASAPVEEQVQALRELPEPIQRAIPQITLGGYMYSKNPADRLLLIDKVLRREGEEVAPGLILDKLQPKQAIFSFRGYRYRVPL